MKSIFASEEIKIKKFQQKISTTGKKFVICDNWHDFAKNYNDKVDFMVLPHQTKNGMWGVVYWLKGLSDGVFYYSASDSTYIGEERKEVKQLSEFYTSPNIVLHPDSSCQSPRMNTGNSVEFSEVYANYMVERLAELCLIHNYTSDISDISDADTSDISNTNRTAKAQHMWNGVTHSPNVVKHQNVKYQTLGEELLAIANKFSERLKVVIKGQPINIPIYLTTVPDNTTDPHFTGDNANVVACTGWRTPYDNHHPGLAYHPRPKITDGFYLKIRISRDRMKVFHALAHELAHIYVSYEECRHNLYFNQAHSKAFWEAFLDGSNSTFDFVSKKLNHKDREKFAKLAKPTTNGIEDKEKIINCAYFPIRAKNEHWVNMTYMSKKVYSARSVDAAWDLTRKKVFALADAEMNNHFPIRHPIRSDIKWQWNIDPKNSEIKKRWLQIEIKQKGEVDDDGTRSKEYKIYVYHDKNSPIKELLKNELCHHGGGFKEKEKGKENSFFSSEKSKEKRAIRDASIVDMDSISIDNCGCENLLSEHQAAIASKLLLSQEPDQPRELENQIQALPNTN